MTEPQPDVQPGPLTADEAVRRLDALTGDDPEGDHGEADDILEALIPAEVWAARVRAQERARGWWWA